MDESFSDSARAVMDLAQREASAVGAARVHCEHLMLALCQSDEGQVLAAAGLTHERVREMLSLVLCGTRAHGRTTEPRELLTADSHVRRAVKNAAQQAAGRGLPAADASHLLAGTLLAHRLPGGELAGGCAITALMRHAAEGPDALLRRALAHVDAESGAGEAFPYLGTDFTFPRSEQLRAWAQRAAVVAAYAAMAVPLSALTPAGPERTFVIGAICAGLVVSPVLNITIWQHALAGRIARDAVQVPVPGLGRALRRAGVRHLTVALLPAGRRPAGRSLGRAYRAWDQATIILNPAAREASPAVIRFLTAHEAAHVARGDPMTLAMAWSYLVTLTGAFVIAALRWAWLAAAAAIAFVMLKWTAELACDRIAARVTGMSCATDFADYIERAAASPRLTRARRLRALLKHPPARMRRTRIMRNARPEKESGLDRRQRSAR